MANYLRFKLSYRDENFDYDQALFVLIVSTADGSTKISLNGLPLTLLESRSFHAKAPHLVATVIELLSDDFQELYPSILVQKHPDEERFWRSLDWYSRSFIKDNGLDEKYAIICMSIAFESLLNLPSEKISASFKSVISNFFGNIPNLVWWAEDFYNIRSKIVHGDDISLERSFESSRTKREKAPSIYFLPLAARKNLRHRQSILQGQFSVIW